MSHEVRGPTCATQHGEGWVDDGTLCTSHSSSPVSVGLSQDTEPSSLFPCEVNSEGIASIYRARLVRNDASSDWRQILKVHIDYYDRNLRNPHSVVLAHQMLLIALASYHGLKEKGGWAGRFVTHVFMHTSKDVDEHPGYWDHPPGTSKHQFAMHCSPADYDFSAVIAGEHHFKRHLKASFYSFISSEMMRLAKSSSKGNQLIQMKKFLVDLKVEHENFFDRAVAPSFDKVHELTWFAQMGAKMKVPDNAGDLREETVAKVLHELRAKKLISGSDAANLRSAAGIKN